MRRCGRTVTVSRLSPSLSSAVSTPWRRRPGRSASLRERLRRPWTPPPRRGAGSGRGSRGGVGPTPSPGHFMIEPHIYLPGTASDDAHRPRPSRDVPAAQRHRPALPRIVHNDNLGISRSQVRVLPGAQFPHTTVPRRITTGHGRWGSAGQRRRTLASGSTARKVKLSSR